MVVMAVVVAAVDRRKMGKSKQKEGRTWGKEKNRKRKGNESRAKKKKTLRWKIGKRKKTRKTEIMTTTAAGVTGEEKKNAAYQDTQLTSPSLWLN